MLTHMWALGLQTRTEMAAHRPDCVCRSGGLLSPLHRCPNYTLCWHHCQLCWVWWSYASRTPSWPGPQVNQIQSAEDRSWNSLNVANGLKAHLHKHYLHDNRFGVPGKQTQVQREQHCRRHRTEGIQIISQMSAYMVTTMQQKWWPRSACILNCQTWQTLFLSHLGTDEQKQHVCETFFENEILPTFFLVQTWTHACPRMIKKISRYVRWSVTNFAPSWNWLADRFSNLLCICSVWIHVLLWATAESSKHKL